MNSTFRLHHNIQNKNPNMTSINCQYGNAFKVCVNFINFDVVVGVGCLSKQTDSDGDHASENVCVYRGN